MAPRKGRRGRWRAAEPPQAPRPGLGSRCGGRRRVGAGIGRDGSRDIDLGVRRGRGRGRAGLGHGGLCHDADRRCPPGRRAGPSRASIRRLRPRTSAPIERSTRPRFRGARSRYSSVPGRHPPRPRSPSVRHQTAPRARRGTGGWRSPRRPRRLRRGRASPARRWPSSTMATATWSSVSATARTSGASLAMASTGRVRPWMRSDRSSRLPNRSSTSAASAVAGARPSRARRTAAIAARPIQKAPPSSPSRYPWPPMTCGRPACGAARQATPVPTLTLTPAHRERAGVGGHGIVRQPHVRRSDPPARPNRRGGAARARRRGTSSGPGRSGPRSGFRRLATHARPVAITAPTTSPSSRLTPSSSTVSERFRVADTDGRLTPVHGQDPEQ